jgi:CMP-N,N'-diacetyllegionaminic acid synthase
VRILALIPARGGSKRLPGKNIRLLGGKPLIAWSIDVAKDIPEICEILISTDDPAIASVCKDRGTSVPWLRPSELATDTASSVDVALHALDWYESKNGIVDGILLLQPTSPFRTKTTIKRGIELFIKYDQQPVLGVSPTHAHPMWTFKMEGDYLVPFVKVNDQKSCSKELPLAYVVNGSFYLVTPRDLRDSRSFRAERSIPLMIDSPNEAIDIDTEWDWCIAESVLAYYGST